MTSTVRAAYGIVVVNGEQRRAHRDIDGTIWAQRASGDWTQVGRVVRKTFVANPTAEMLQPLPLYTRAHRLSLRRDGTEAFCINCGVMVDDDETQASPCVQPEWDGDSYVH